MTLEDIKAAVDAGQTYAAPVQQLSATGVSLCGTHA